MNDDEMTTINNRLGLLVKINIVLVPIALAGLIALQTYFVKQINAIDNRVTKIEEWKAIGPRYTATDAAVLKADLLNIFNQQLSGLQRDVLKVQVLLEEHMKIKQP